VRDAVIALLLLVVAGLGTLLWRQAGRTRRSLTADQTAADTGRTGTSVLDEAARHRLTAPAAAEPDIPDSPGQPAAGDVAPDAGSPVEPAGPGTGPAGEPLAGGSAVETSGGVPATGETAMGQPAAAESVAAEPGTAETETLPGQAVAGDRDEELRARIRREVERELSDLRMQAIQSAAAVRSEAETLAAFTRSMAEAEAATLRRTAQTETDNIRRAVEAESENARRQAALEVSTLVLEGRRQAERESAEITERARVLQADVERREERLVEREQRLDEAHRRIEQRDRELLEAQRGLDAREAEALARGSEIQLELERVAGLTAADARAELLKDVEEQCRRDAAIIVRDVEAEARQTGEVRARQIVVDSIQRVASEQTAESVVSVLHLPGDEMKGRIIGREGRNIRAFESVTGVNLIIDDTPEAVLLSCFDPVRREIGRLTLEKLVLDGRIHPQRIEEIYERSKEEVEQLCVRAGEDALVEVGIAEMHPELVKLLGRLRYRTSYGQNVLKHLVETAHIAGIMAAELKMDGKVLKRSAFLHDIGKALTHEVEGSHALIGADLARKYGEIDDVVHSIEAHHNEVPPLTIEAVLTQASDSCSGGRPGARRESLEAYVKRLERIEEIAASRPGVDRVFAMQAGREVRVIVAPDQVDDVTAHLLAREVAKQIEDELTYPGSIRVTVVRESRATEIAR
jgi:ribonuclease Y